MSLTEEKGVDVAIATDMIKLAWEDVYDWAVLVSSDRDFVPAVEFLNAKGRKVLHAGFPPGVVIWRPSAGGRWTCARICPVSSERRRLGPPNGGYGWVAYKRGSPREDRCCTPCSVRRGQ